VSSAPAIRRARESDHALLIGRVNEWRGGRDMAPLLPRLFFQHFHDTGLVTESDGDVVGFVIGFVSQAEPAVGYIHFVGVFAIVLERGCTEVRCVTSPVNTASIAFHRRMGFVAEPGDAESDGTPYQTDYDGPGGHRVRFRRQLTR
jgi:hypothetical protein